MSKTCTIENNSNLNLKQKLKTENNNRKRKEWRKTHLDSPGCNSPANSPAAAQPKPSNSNPARPT
jgi:hypothetical protein